MATFSELWAAYGRDPRPANIGASINGVLIGELDDEVQDVAGSYAGLGADVGAWRAARLGLALERITRVLPLIEPENTRAYFERLASLARSALAEIANEEFLNIPGQLAALAELAQLLPGDGMDYWLFGGWAVDFHAGRVTREHADIDIAVWSDDRESLATLLLDRAWVYRPEVGEDGYTCYERNGIRLEVAFLARDARGHIYTPLREGRGEWPADSFGDDVAQLRGVRARVISRESLIADKSIVRSDAVTAAKDHADVASLLHSGVEQ
ncbi:MAG TPA: hypothetical protein VK636_08420 [Gemmatimonadaceae bacterium]|nr:hypothetical protein [Gemmatimonadaceae bacterium]